MTGAPIDLTRIDTDGLDEGDLRALVAHAQDSLRSRDQERAAEQITAMASMSDEAIATLIAEHEDTHDECDGAGWTGGYHDEKACVACVGRATLDKRRIERERSLPGACTANSYMTRCAEDLVVGDQVKAYPNPGSRGFHYVEAMSIEFLDEETMKVMWRKTNTEDVWFPGTYDRHEAFDINRTYPRG